MDDCLIAFVTALTSDILEPVFKLNWSSSASTKISAFLFAENTSPLGPERGWVTGNFLRSFFIKFVERTYI